MTLVEECSSPKTRRRRSRRSLRRLPDLVLLDLRLPGIQGDAVFAELRRKYPSLPIVIVSANGDAERARELIRHGAFDYLSKPWDFDYLERVVSAATIAS